MISQFNNSYWRRYYHSASRYHRTVIPYASYLPMWSYLTLKTVVINLVSVVTVLRRLG